jgi:hypothetical protein
MDIYDGDAFLTGWNRIQESRGRFETANRHASALQHPLEGFSERTVIIDNKYAYSRLLHYSTLTPAAGYLKIDHFPIIERFIWGNRV